VAANSGERLDYIQTLPDIVLSNDVNLEGHSVHTNL
jgi:hypothetical protein